MFEYINNVNIKNRDYNMYIPLSNERIDIVINKNYYDIYADNDNIEKNILMIKRKRDDTIMAKKEEIYTIKIDDEICYCNKIKNISIDYQKNNIYFITITSKRKNTSYLFLLPLCKKAKEFKMLPIIDTYIIPDEPLQLIIKFFKPFICERVRYDIIKEDDIYIYIKSSLNSLFINDINLIYEGRYSLLSADVKELIYKYHILSYIPRSEHFLYDIFNKTKKRREMLSRELKIDIHPLQELYSKITKEEVYAL